MFCRRMASRRVTIGFHCTYPVRLERKATASASASASASAATPPLKQRKRSFNIEMERSPLAPWVDGIPGVSEIVLWVSKALRKKEQLGSYGLVVGMEAKTEVFPAVVLGSQMSTTR